ncbi:MAG: phytoene/squalene synthase family protein [Gemmatimonadaceae bacterium]|nr:phytoene/squalene synthase family protein [Gemmatimonadaceae bacterium]
MTASALAAVAAPPRASGWAGYMGRHGQSFAFASAFMPASERKRISAIYAWCRYTDDLVDIPQGRSAETYLDGWLALSRAAYDGRATGIELLDDVMPLARRDGVSFRYPAELIEGMRMDLRHEPYEDLAALRIYLWRAAGTVGLWLAESYGIRDAWALERAAQLGQAMQLTNIIRDVGEDLDRGRLYLPLDRIAAYGLTPAMLVEARRTGTPLGAGWCALIEELIAVAEHDYAEARDALHLLPAGFRQAASVASLVYAGIHGAVRRIGHQTLLERAATTRAEKIALAFRAVST